MDSDKLKYIQPDQVRTVQPMSNNSVQLEINSPAGLQIPAPTQNSFRPVGPKSMEMICPSCRCHIRTNVRHRSTAKTHIACLLLTATCCCCLPYCMDTCRNTNHFCPMCESFLGTYTS